MVGDYTENFQNRKGEIVALVFEDHHKKCFRLQAPISSDPLPAEFWSARDAWDFFHANFDAETGQPKQEQAS